MAQQLVTERTPAAYAGVLAYAASHPGEAAASAELAIGHAYMLDRRYAEAENAFRQASTPWCRAGRLRDLPGSPGSGEGNRPQDAIPLLTQFSDRHPNSVFDSSAPILLANAYLASNDANGALRVLQPLLGSPISESGRFSVSACQGISGERDHQKAASLYRGIYLGDPLSPEASTAKAQLLL